MKVVVDINALPCKNGKDCTECAFYPVESICEIPTALQSFPKYEDQRSHGEWIKGAPWSRGVGMGELFGYYYTCSECGHKVEGGYKSCGINFCQKCGSDNRKIGE